MQRLVIYNKSGEFKKPGVPLPGIDVTRHILDVLVAKGLLTTEDCCVYTVVPSGEAGSTTNTLTYNSTLNSITSTVNGVTSSATIFLDTGDVTTNVAYTINAVNYPTGTALSTVLTAILGQTHAPVTVTDSSSVNFTLTDQNITAVVIPSGLISADEGNVLTLGSDSKLYVPITTFLLTAGTTGTVSDDSLGSKDIFATETIHFWSPEGDIVWGVASGTAVISASVKLSTDAGNNLSRGTDDGLFLDVNLASAIDTSGIVGAPGSTQTIQALLDELASTTLTTNITVSDTSSINLTLAGTALSGVVICGGLISADADNDILLGTDSLLYLQVAGASVIDTNGLVGTPGDPVTLQALLDEVTVHDPVTVTDSSTIDFTLSTQNITASIVGASGASAGQVPTSNGSGGITWAAPSYTPTVTIGIGTGNGTGGAQTVTVTKTSGGAFTSYADDRILIFVNGLNYEWVADYTLGTKTATTVDVTFPVGAIVPPNAKIKAHAI